MSHNPGLTRDCDEPSAKGETWGDVLVLAIELQEANAECTRRMRALRGE